ncbi:MAG: hypothetical protein MUF15_19435 [Acidobacteria bacterium]|nr:hypothetical protein [Acidobacteriota bacterium]
MNTDNIADRETLKEQVKAILKKAEEGVFPKNFSKIISRLFRERQEGDYGFYIDISEEEILIDVKSAELFLKTISKHLKEEN